MLGCKDVALIFVSTILFDGTAAQARSPIVVLSGEGCTTSICFLRDWRLTGPDFRPRGGSCRFVCLLLVTGSVAGKTRLCSGLYECAWSCQPNLVAELTNVSSKPRPISLVFQDHVLS